MSIEMTSPSRTSAIGPPAAASGETWPMAAPRVAPEKRPSVMSAVSASRPMPARALVASSISRMPGPPRGPFVADDDDVAGVDPAADDRRVGGIFRVEDPRGPSVLEHGRGDGRALHHRAVGGEVAAEHGDPASRGVGLLDSADHDAVGVGGLGGDLAYRLAGDRERASVDEAFLEELLDDGEDSARLVELAQVVRSRRREPAEVRRLRGDFVREVEVEPDARLVGDGRQMQHAVRAAAEGHVEGQRVAELPLVEEIARLNVLLDRVHDDGARAFGKPIRSA